MPVLVIDKESRAIVAYGYVYEPSHYDNEQIDEHKIAQGIYCGYLAQTKCTILLFIIQTLKQKCTREDETGYKLHMLAVDPGLNSKLKNQIDRKI